MGLFDKIKQNVSHGGVKVQVQAPSSVPGNQVIPVVVTLTADNQQTINNVKAEIKAEAKEEGLSIGNGVGVQQGRTTAQTIAQVESRQPFSIGPGETKTVNLQLYINGSTGAVNPSGLPNDMSGGAGGAVQAITSLMQGLGHVHYIYTVHASADVEGVAIDPGDKMPIQILPPTASTPQAPAPVQSPVQPPANPPVQAVQPIQPMQPVQPNPIPPVNPPGPQQPPN